MLNELRRFVSLRGRPRKIRIDCGTNITKADKELKANVEEWNKSSIENFCMYTKGDWLGIILSCVWERIILSVRQILRASLTQLTVCAEVISTIIIVVEVLNTLHLTTFYICDHVLHYHQEQWRQAQLITNIFWKRLTKEYLPCLQRRQKWNELQKNLKMGDVVLSQMGIFQEDSGH